MITFDSDGQTMFETDDVTLVVRASGSHEIVALLANAISAREAVFRHLAQVVVENGFDVPPFICLRRDGSELHLFLVGEVTARITGPVEMILDGTGTSTWTEHTAPIAADVTVMWSVADGPPIEAAAADLDESPPPSEADPGTDPTAQIPARPGSPVAEMPEPAAVGTSAEASQETPAHTTPKQPPQDLTPPLPPVPPTPVTSRPMPDPNLLGSDHVDIVVGEASEGIKVPSPVATEPAAPPPPTPSETNKHDRDRTLDTDVVRREIAADPPADPPRNSPLVTARVCPCGAPSPLSVEFCSACGSSMRREGVTIGQVPRPLLGNLVLDDGTVLPLDDTFVMGRKVPATHEIDGRIYPGVTVDSPTKQVSKVHLEVRLVDWTVNVIDLDSANGTYIEDAGGHSPKRLRPNVVEQVSPGDTVHFGDRSFVFEAISGP